MVKFNSTDFEDILLRQIANRAVASAKEAGLEYLFMEAIMDITACHCNGCPLHLSDLLNAQVGDFGHDVFGIRRYLDRKTGKLTEQFSPRFALAAC